MQFIGDLLRTEMLQTAVIWDLRYSMTVASMTVDRPEMLSVYLI